jgi:predicted transcriptional regulator
MADENLSKAIKSLRELYLEQERLLVQKKELDTLTGSYQESVLAYQTRVTESLAVIKDSNPKLYKSLIQELAVPDLERLVAAPEVQAAKPEAKPEAKAQVPKQDYKGSTFEPILRYIVENGPRTNTQIYEALSLSPLKGRGGLVNLQHKKLLIKNKEGLYEVTNEGKKRYADIMRVTTQAATQQIGLDDSIIKYISEQGPKTRDELYQSSEINLNKRKLKKTVGSLLHRGLLARDDAGKLSLTGKAQERLQVLQSAAETAKDEGLEAITSPASSVTPVEVPEGYGTNTAVLCALGQRAYERKELTKALPSFSSRYITSALTRFKKRGVVKEVDGKLVLTEKGQKAFAELQKPEPADKIKNLPKDKAYTAADLAKELGVGRNRIGLLLNRNDFISVFHNYYMHKDHISDKKNAEKSLLIAAYDSGNKTVAAIQNFFQAKGIDVSDYTVQKYAKLANLSLEKVVAEPKVTAGKPEAAKPVSLPSAETMQGELLGKVQDVLLKAASSDDTFTVRNIGEEMGLAPGKAQHPIYGILYLLRDLGHVEQTKARGPWRVTTKFRQTMAEIGESIAADEAKDKVVRDEVSLLTDLPHEVKPPPAPVPELPKKEGPPKPNELQQYRLKQMERFFKDCIPITEIIAQKLSNGNKLEDTLTGFVAVEKIGNHNVLVPKGVNIDVFQRFYDYIQKNSSNLPDKQTVAIDMGLQTKQVELMVHGFKKAGIADVTLGKPGEVRIKDYETLQQRINDAALVGKSSISTNDLRTITNMSEDELMKRKDDLLRVFRAAAKKQFPNKKISLEIVNYGTGPAVRVEVKE